MIVLKDLTKTFGAARAVDSLSLEIPAGEMIAIQGPSGSGKTTLLRLIAGLELPDQGQISMDGEVVSRPGWAVEPWTRGIGIVFQRCALWPHMTVAQNILFAMNGAQRDQKKIRLEGLLQQIHLEALAGRYPFSLSGGEARRVAIARALAAEPRRLLMDEPLTNLDHDLKRQLLDVILGYAASRGTTLIYITHEEDEASLLGGRWLHMQNGRLI